MIGKQIPAGTGYQTIKTLVPKELEAEKEDNSLMDEETKKLFEEVEEE